MTEKLQAIVLGSVRHSDKTVIVNVYTQSRGHMSLLVNIGSAKSARRHSSLIMPLSQIEFECRAGENRELQRPQGMQLTYSYRSLYFSPQKNALGFFLAEFLSRLLREADSDRLAYRFISESLMALDALPGPVANFHIAFLAGLTTFMGIAPDLDNYTAQSLFDMRAGGYTRLHPGHNDILVGENAAVPLLLARINYANMHRLHLSRDSRATLLSGLLRYWGIHFPGTATLRSPEILATLFD